MERATALDVFYGDELIGTVFDTEPLSFEYAPTWLGRQQPTAPFPLSSIALQPGRLVEPQVQAFFENLQPKGHAPSTHILKPDIRRLAKVRDSAVNEAIIMRTAQHCGLRTAEVFYEPLTKACVVERFDRLRRDDGGLSRVILYDLCQLAGTVSEKKYEKEGGPGLQTCARLIREHSSRAALDLQALVQWVFFSIYVGNNDSHAKNLSLYVLPGQGRWATRSCKAWPNNWA